MSSQNGLFKKDQGSLTHPWRKFPSERGEGNGLKNVLIFYRMSGEGVLLISFEGSAQAGIFSGKPHCHYALPLRHINMVDGRTLGPRKSLRLAGKSMIKKMRRQFLK